jgi:chromate transporter
MFKVLQAESMSWLLLVHQIPARPTSGRVRIWRRLQDIGAVALKQSVYVLPASDQSREDFEWIKSEIQTLHGEAAVFTVQSIDAFTNDEVIGAFRQARQADYAGLAREAEALIAGADKRGAKPAGRQSVARRIVQLRERLSRLDAIAFFPPPNRDATAAAVGRLERSVAAAPATTRTGSADVLDRDRFQRRVWVTRPRPGVDRMSSAWLIRRFIDPKARFAFAAKAPASGAAIPFDMYGVEFSHTDHGCTFETLAARFGIVDAAVQRIAQIVHDLDMKETRDNAPETPGVAHLVEGLRAAFGGDEELLDHGMVMFDAFYRSFAAGAPSGPARRARRRSREHRPMVSIGRLGLYFLRLGATGFGGPIALAGAMQRTLVHERGWISKEEYLEGLALAQLAPGPLAAQLAMYLGYVRGGTAGATIVGAAFILPSLLIVWMLAALYVRFDGLWWMRSLFYGVGAAVIGIIARSVIKLARLSLADDWLRWAIAVVLATTTAVTGRESIGLFLLGGCAPMIVRSRAVPAAAAMFPAAAGVFVAAASDRSLAAIGWFFARAGAFVFGSGLAVVPFLYGGLVEERHWLTDRQFLDAVAVAMITPGPVVITVGFIGYLLRGTPGLLVAAAGVFLPVYLVVVLIAPWFRRWSAHRRVALFVSGVTAAATGAIAGAATVLARRAIIDRWTLGIAVVAFAVLTARRVSELWLIAAAGALGLWLHGS